MGSVARLSLVELRMHISRNRIDRFERIMTVIMLYGILRIWISYSFIVFAPMFIDQFRRSFKIRDVTDSSDTCLFLFFSKITNNFYFQDSS